eukprot:CAMPEP_0177695724 /NCGR_PEP_ID=MMETSP0484_2-20121128/3607_1 /TAXON_ID=354590 /ORGANISM="Rhodomonas lens, Strain RHODO" /LENGTH=421 /DNA_ID=CAMNT_0019206663 /DNA_START=176 /DNA_END=1438 /DNA_ORIENTATION=-
MRRATCHVAAQLLLLPILFTTTVAFSTIFGVHPMHPIGAISQATQLQQPRFRDFRVRQVFETALPMSLNQPAGGEEDQSSTDRGEAMRDEEDQSSTDWGEAMRQLRQRKAVSSPPQPNETPVVPAKPTAVPAVTTISASKCARGGAVDAAAALEADGVVRINSAITSGMASELLASVNDALEDALRETQDHEEFGEEWQTRFGNVLSRPNRHDIKLSLEAPPVRAALTALLSTLEDVVSDRLGEDALLYELGALISFPGAKRQPVHPDTPIVAGKGTDQGVTILTAFCALQDVDATMGPTIFLPATHTEEAHAAFFTYENFELTFDLGDEEDEEDAEEAEREARVAALLESWSPWRGELGAGDVCVFDSRCLHAGGANASEKARVLFHCSFIKAAHEGSCAGTLLEALRGRHALKDWRQWL